MIFCIKNYHKNINSSLTARSIKYFDSNHRVFLLNVYKGEIDRTDLQIELFDGIFDFKAKYDFGPGEGSPANGYYFTEGINYAQKCFEDSDEKIVVLDEDHFFTTGQTIKELEENEYDLAWAFWISPPPESDNTVSGAIISFRPKRVASLFPLPERMQYIEHLLKEEFLEKLPKELISYRIKNRHHGNYYGDGFFTNDHNEILTSLQNNNIL
jgi:hypothetical protein